MRRSKRSDPPASGPSTLKPTDSLGIKGFWSRPSSPAPQSESTPPSGSSALKSTGTAILGGAVISLTLLEKMMDGVPIPFVKGSAGAALEVIKIIKTIEANKSDCEDLEKRSTSLLVVILNSFNGKTEAEIPDHLRRGVERLTMSFHEVLAMLETVGRRGKRVMIGPLYASDNAEKLKSCIAKLDWAMQEFQVTSKVDSCLKDLERHEELKK
ncbi:hypothetical protein FRC03_005443, partial [Tulasnella sp. 419]